MPRVARNDQVFSRLNDVSAEMEASKATVRHTSPPTSLDHDDAHTHAIDGWAGDTYALPTPINTLDGDSGQIALRGHASQTVTFGGFNYGATVPVLPTDPTKMTVITWKRMNGSFVAVSTGEKDWVY